jgi:hypothetical protein
MYLQKCKLHENRAKMEIALLCMMPSMFFAASLDAFWISNAINLLKLT